MSSERWRRAKELFEQALRLPTAERGPFLAAESDGDEALRAAVARWLEADADASGFLDEPVLVDDLTGASDGTPPRAAAMPGQLGPYQVLEEVGRGGMGVVYRGLRDDEAFRREVAIKVLAFDDLSSDARRRLEIERQILASLDHPGIARVYDGGTASSGLPFLVMEFVEGEPIDDYCDRLDLSVRQLIVLFRQVCDAVRASHQNLIVHCDLKPSNILVTREGQPKLLDFGIAKLLSDEGLGAAGSPITRWSRPLTPQYASPEQLRGEAISTASDVYSLGVLLFKLLTGQRPFALEGLSAAERNQRLEGVAERPSAVAAAAGATDRARQIRGDLDAIVGKAMRAVASERYPSVERMSADLDRYLEGLAVHARQGNTRYRLGKFLRRHRAAVATCLLFVGLLCAYAFSMASMAGRLADERDRLQGMNDFTLGIFDVGSPEGETRAPTLLDAIDQNVDGIDQRHQDQPEVLAAVLGAAADIYRQLGQPETARTLAERALALHATLDGEDSLLYADAQIRLGTISTELGEHEAAVTSIRAGLDWIRRHPGVDATFLVRALNALVYDFCYRYEHASADALSAEAWNVAEDRLDRRSTEAAAAAVQRGAVLSHLDRLDEAQDFYLEGLERYASLQGREHPYRATLLNNLGKIYLTRENYADAWETYRQADAHYVKVFGETTSARLKPLLGMAKASAERGRHDNALVEFRRAVEVSMARDSPQLTARVASYLASYLVDRGDCSTDEDLLRRALERARDETSDLDPIKALEQQMVECGFSAESLAWSARVPR